MRLISPKRHTLTTFSCPAPPPPPQLLVYTPVSFTRADASRKRAASVVLWRMVDVVRWLLIRLCFSVGLFGWWWWWWLGLRNKTRSRFWESSDRKGRMEWVAQSLSLESIANEKKTQKTNKQKIKFKSPPPKKSKEFQKKKIKWNAVAPDAQSSTRSSHCVSVWVCLCVIERERENS